MRLVGSYCNLQQFSTKYSNIIKIVHADHGLGYDNLGETQTFQTTFTLLFNFSFLLIVILLLFLVLLGLNTSFTNLKLFQ